MIELLLQAETALAGGMLDQAERVYWQLIERDAQNAIAVAGLARVCLERGDLETAHLFAAKALVLDPDSVAAQKVVEALEQGPGLPPVEPSDVPELPLLAAERLEALSRRRRAEEEPSDESAPRNRSAAPAAPNFAAGIASHRREALKRGDVQAVEAPDVADKPAQATPGGARQAKPILKPRSHGEQPRGLRKRPGAPPEPVVDLEADQFAAAEAAAAIEAIDAVDTFEIAPPRRRGSRAADIARRRRGGPEREPDPAQAEPVAAVSEPEPLEPGDDTEAFEAALDIALTVRAQPAVEAMPSTGPGTEVEAETAEPAADGATQEADDVPDFVAGRQLDAGEWTPEELAGLAPAEPAEGTDDAGHAPADPPSVAEIGAPAPAAAAPAAPEHPAPQASAPKPVAPRSTAPARPPGRQSAPQPQQRPKKGLLRRILGG